MDRKFFKVEKCVINWHQNEVEKTEYYYASSAEMVSLILQAKYGLDSTLRKYYREDETEEHYLIEELVVETL